MKDDSLDKAERSLVSYKPYIMADTKWPADPSFWRRNRLYMLTVFVICLTTFAVAFYWKEVSGVLGI